jgi:hypothetical protein
MVNGLHKPVWNRTKKPLAIVSGRVERGLRGREDGTMLQMYSAGLIGIVTMNLPLYNKYIITKNLLQKLS